MSGFGGQPPSKSPTTDAAALAQAAAANDKTFGFAGQVACCAVSNKNPAVTKLASELLRDIPISLNAMAQPAARSVIAALGGGVLGGILGDPSLAFLAGSVPVLTSLVAPSTPGVRKSGNEIA